MTSAFGGQRSIQLSYGCERSERLATLWGEAKVKAPARRRATACESDQVNLLLALNLRLRGPRAGIAELLEELAIRLGDGHVETPLAAVAQGIIGDVYLVARLPHPPPGAFALASSRKVARRSLRPHP